MSENFDMPGVENSFEIRGGWLVKRLMSDFDLSSNQAAGIVGNLGYESVGLKVLQEIRPSVEGSRGGFGWAQWTGPRRRQFESWAQANGLDVSSDEANYGFLKFELSGDYKSTIRKVKMFESLEDSVFSVGQTYERPGGTTTTNLPGFRGRLSYARQALSGMQSVDEVDKEVEEEEVEKEVEEEREEVEEHGGDPVLRKGSKGESVKELQELLGDAFLVIDGDFGRATEASVKRFQRKNELIADGIVGPLTWGALRNN